MATIVPAPSSQSVAAALAATGVGTLTTPTYEWFTDDETLLSVPEFDDDTAIIVGSTATNDAHIELLQLQDAVREAGATDSTTVIPYLGYARQDQGFKPGQPVSARAMAKWFSSMTSSPPAAR